MLSKPKLIITFIKGEQNNPFKSFNFLKKDYPIIDNKNEENIDIIDDDIFEKDKESQIVEFKLLSKKDDNYFIYKFNLYYGVNRAYCFLINYTKFLFELCFRENKNVIFRDLILKETDYFDNDSRRRMILINAPIATNIEGAF